jgi:hypothetical protein
MTAMLRAALRRADRFVVRGRRTENRSALGAALRSNDAGSMLIETLIACGILIVVMAGVMSIGVVSMTTTENQGHLAARTTEYSQDKMEQLVALAWTDTLSDTRVFPATQAGGTGLAVGGSLNPAAPAAGYVDYLDVSGNLLPAGAGAPANWYYVRVWQVTNPSANLKQISVTSTVRWGFGRQLAPISTVTVLKTRFPWEI